MAQQQRLPFGFSQSTINIAITCGGLGLIFFAGVYCIAKFTSTISDTTLASKVFAISAMLAISSHLVGWLIGFIFGIPRTVQDQEHRTDGAGTAHREHAPRNEPRSAYRVNTNLEQVSDWLTKILVGVGLTQFGNIKSILLESANYFAAGIVDVDNIEPMITAIMVYYLIGGFLSGYFLTRLFFSEAFSQVDEELTQENGDIRAAHDDGIDVTNFSPQEQGFLADLIGLFEHGKSYIVPEEFTAYSEQHTVLLQLEKRHLIVSQDGTEWCAGNYVELTPSAQTRLDTIKRILSEL